MIYWCTVCVISFVVVVTTFEIQCPHSSHWKKRSTQECVLVSSYLCLFNPLKSSYDEKCGSEDIARKGFKYILTPNLHQRECLSDSYQPFTFTTNGNSECIFAKSNCNDDGQVKASEGSTVLDRTCKCDYTRGYSYITRPRNICSCVPSEEDCTCYFSPCKDNNQVMVSDYTCKAKNQLHSSACPAISSLPDFNSKVNGSDLYGNGISKTNMSAPKFLLLIIALAVLFIVIYLVWIRVRPEITNYKVTPEINLIFCDDNSNAAFDGDQLIIECEYRSKLSVYFTWWKEVHGNFEELLESDIIKGTKTSKLRIKPLQLHHEGRYKCVIRIINGPNCSLCNTFVGTMQDLSCFYSENKTTQVFFNHISYDEMLEHREDKLYIKTSSINEAKTSLQRRGIVLITGREGTGKSKLCLELASLFHEEDAYLPFKADLAKNDIYYYASGLFCIFDQTLFETSILKQLVANKNKVVITCRTSELFFMLGKLCTSDLDVNVINLDTALKKTEKEYILLTYMKHFNVFKTSADESNFRNPIIIRDLTIEVKLDHNSVRSIVTSEPYLGFPLSVALFCADRNLLHLGETYFTKPPKYILDAFTKLYNTAKKCTGTEKEILMYSVLVFIYLNNTLNIAELDKNKSSFLALIAQLFKKGNCESLDLTKSVTEAAHCMVKKYLTNNDGIYTFNHHCMSQALLLSCRDFEGVIIQLLLNGSLEDIITFVRSSQHASIDEFTISLKDQHKYLLCERLLGECCATSENQQLINIGSYIYETWIKLRDISFKEKFLSCVTTSRQSLQGNITPFWRIVLVIDHITANGKDSWIYQSDVSDFILLCGIIAASAFHYLSSDLKKETFHIMLNKFNNKIQNKQFLDILCSELDQFGNTFFHYLVIGNENESRHILTENAALLKEKNRLIFGKQNKMKYTPLQSAAYLGKCTILKQLLVKTKDINKGKQHLLNLATMGVEAVFNCTKIGQKYNEDSGKALVDRKRETTHADENATIIYERDKRFEHDSTPIQCETELTRQENVKVSEVKDDGEKTKLDACFEGIPFLVTGNREDFDKILKLLNQKKLDRSVISKELNCMP